MNYIEAFKKLKTYSKSSRRSPHKAVLLLAIIDMFESGELTNNEIRYNEALKRAFNDTWNKLLPNEAMFIPDAYLPFWYMQSEGFWHIIPLSGRDSFIEILRDERIKPSESILAKNVDYVILDEDLFFLMTLQSGRSSLREVLYESFGWEMPLSNSITYTIEEEDPITPTNNQQKQTSIEENARFYELKEDLQYAINIEYFTFLKNKKQGRELLKRICPSVCDLYDRIVINRIYEGEFDVSSSYIYESFLADLRISLMGEDGALDFVDQIEGAIKCLHILPDEQKSNDKNGSVEQEKTALTEVHCQEKDVHSEDSVSAQIELSDRNDSVPYQEALSDDVFFFVSHSGVCGRGIYNPSIKKFKLLAGSKLIENCSKSMSQKALFLDITSNFCEFDGRNYVLLNDYVFNSPSMAAAIVCGRASNGWIEWKNKNGVTLDSVYRRK